MAILVFSNGQNVPVLYEGDETDRILFVDSQIHLDDSIRALKKKILFELWNTDHGLPKCSYEELYLFGYADEAQTKPVHLGQEFGEGEEVPANPYKGIPTTVPSQFVFENRLLLNYPVLYENNVYLCLAEHVFESPRSDAEQETIIRTYFPLLNEKKVSRFAELLLKKGELAKSTRALLDANTQQLYKTVQLFYDVLYATDRDTQYIQRGIQRIHFRIQREKSANISPLDVIFKLIHCSRDILFIKYNPGIRRENLYRLYYEKLSRNGKKIPVLSHRQILKIAKETGKSNQISLYIRAPHSPLYFHFEENGDITIEHTMARPMRSADLDPFFRELLQPIINTLNNGLRQTGVRIPSFESINHPRVRVLEMKYVASTRIEKDVKVEKIDCIYSLLTINQSRESNEPILRYKRVENYKEMNAEMALIHELYNASKFNGMGAQDIIESIMQQFGRTEDQARKSFVDYFSQNTEFGGFVVEHPGFPMKIQIARLDNVLEFEIENIDSIRYVEPIEVYIESIVRMTQDVKARDPLHKHIRDICSKSKKVADADQSHVENMVVAQKKGAPTAAAAVKAFAVSTSGIDIFKELGLNEPEPDIREEMTEHVELVELEKNSDEELRRMMDELHKMPKGVFFEEDEEENEVNEENEKESPKKVDEKLAEKDSSEKLAKEIVEKPAEENAEESPKGVFFEDEEETPESPKPEPEPDQKTPDSDSEAGVFFSDDEDDDEDQAGGAPKKGDSGLPKKGELVLPEGQIRPDGLSLTHPNPFLKRMQAREPTLFLTKPQGKKYKSYSASCQPTSRQPIILTDEEKKRIDRENPGSYKHAIKYGTDPKNPNWYICPRYWCFLTNSSISEDDVKAGKCGEIIPEDAEVIPPGAYVYEFKGEEHVDVKGNYVEHYPGFLKEGKHPDGYCLPCCFKNWDKNHQPERRAQCEPRDDGSTPAPATAAVAAEKNPPKSQLYVISLDTYPVDQSRWGFAPIAVQLFLQVDYRAAMDKNNSALIVPGVPTFLRYGVEQVPKQSFLGVFADIYAYKQKRPIIPSVAELKEILAKRITIDVFVRAHHSSLVSVFQPSGAKPNISKYTESQFAKRLNMKNQSHLDFFQQTVAAYENFIEYITHPTEPIDHTYLWDIFTSDIPEINAGGVNLILLEIMDNDITENIQLVCPTTSFSGSVYDPTKDSVIVLKREDYYEPIYLYEYIKEPQTGIRTQKAFSEKTLHKNIKQLLSAIKKTSTKCTPLPSLPRVYEFEEPIRKDVLLDYLAENAPTAQVVNYRNKVIGMMVRTTNGREVMVPCSPGAPLPSIPIKMMDDETVWTDYHATRDGLIQIYRESGNKIPCLPRVKVMEDELVVGFLTMTNQFIQIMPPLAEMVDDGIPVHRGTNDVSVDTSSGADAQRKEMMARIRLENQFYIAFRSTVRNLLNDYVYKSKRDAIVDVIESKTQLYRDKLVVLERALRDLVDKYVIFVDIAFDVLLDIHEITACNPDEEDNSYCTLLKENGISQLSIPKTNLVSKNAIGTDNERVYYAKLADELLRYTRVRAFMLEPAKYYNMVDVNYRVHAGEMILTQSVIQGNYFDDLEEFAQTDYIKQTNYDTAMPAISYVYANDPIPLSEQREKEIEKQGEKIDQSVVECIDSVIDIVGNAKSIWKRSFPSAAKETVFKNTAQCSFYVLTTIFKAHTGIGYTVDEIKERLWEGYSRLLTQQPRYRTKILAILRRQGKAALMDPVIKDQMAMDARIFSEDYYVSDFDIWVIAQFHSLPVFLFNPNGLKGFVKDLQWLKCGGKITDRFYFIRSTIDSTSNKISSYHLVQPAFALSELREFYGIINSAIQGNPEYERNLRSIETTLDNMEVIVPKR